jgi:hypothetical protein
LKDPLDPVDPAMSSQTLDLAVQINGLGSPTPLEKCTTIKQPKEIMCFQQNR